MSARDTAHTYLEGWTGKQQDEEYSDRRITEVLLNATKQMIHEKDPSVKTPQSLKEFVAPPKLKEVVIPSTSKTAPDVPTSDVVMATETAKEIEEANPRSFRWAQVLSQVFDNPDIGKKIGKLLNTKPMKGVKKTFTKLRSDFNKALGYATTAKNYAESIMKVPAARMALEALASAATGDPLLAPLIESAYESAGKFKEMIPEAVHENIPKALSALKQVSETVEDEPPSVVHPTEKPPSQDLPAPRPVQEQKSLTERMSESVLKATVAPKATETADLELDQLRERSETLARVGKADERAMKDLKEFEKLEEIEKSKQQPDPQRLRRIRDAEKRLHRIHHMNQGLLSAKAPEMTSLAEEEEKGKPAPSLEEMGMVFDPDEPDGGDGDDDGDGDGDGDQPPLEPPVPDDPDPEPEEERKGRPPPAQPEVVSGPEHKQGEAGTSGIHEEPLEVVIREDEPLRPHFAVPTVADFNAREEALNKEIDLQALQDSFLEDMDYFSNALDFDPLNPNHMWALNTMRAKYSNWTLKPDLGEAGKRMFNGRRIVTIPSGRDVRPRRRYGYQPHTRPIKYVNQAVLPMGTAGMVDHGNIRFKGNELPAGIPTPYKPKGLYSAFGGRQIEWRGYAGKKYRGRMI
jgi:hypothetical protein